MLADRVPALGGWKAAAALPFASVAMNAIGRQFVYARNVAAALRRGERAGPARDRKSTRLNSSHLVISYAVFCLKKKKPTITSTAPSTRTYSLASLLP